MGVHPQVGASHGMAGNVHVHRALAIDSSQEIVRVVLKIDAVDVDVVDVQQQVAVGFGQHGVDEFEFRHFRAGGGVAGHVFDADAAFKVVLRLTDAVGDVADRILGEGDGHQVVEVALLVAAPTEVFGVGPDLVKVQKGLHIGKQPMVQGSGAAD